VHPSRHRSIDRGRPQRGASGEARRSEAASRECRGLETPRGWRHGWGARRGAAGSSWARRRAAPAERRLPAKPRIVDASRGAASAAFVRRNYAEDIDRLRSRCNARRWRLSAGGVYRSEAPIGNAKGTRVDLTSNVGHAPNLLFFHETLCFWEISRTFFLTIIPKQRKKII